VVEGQHRIATVRLTDSVADQAILERLVEEAKPPLPPSARGLPWLLASAFRYGHATASRFRRAHQRPGVFHAAERLVTAIAEVAWWRLAFLARSPGMAWPSATAEHTAISVEVTCTRALDLTTSPFDSFGALWMHPDDYGPCQALGDAARAIHTQAIRYASVRDPPEGRNLAVFDPAALDGTSLRHERTLLMRFDQPALSVVAAFPGEERLRFTMADFGLS
jgi:hypothetical protein